MNYLDKKRHNNHKKYLNYNSHILRFGSYGIKALGFGRLEETTIKALERFLLKNLKIISKSSVIFKVWSIVQLNSNNTALSPESRMGKGKGSLVGKFAFIKPGQLLFEFSGISETQALILWSQFNSKVKFPTKLMKLK